ncbi:MAG: ATP-dependent 6-phosphofructokinase [Chthoniobacteraceae bacterium]
METKIEPLGAAKFRSPLHHATTTANVHFRTDADRVLMDDTFSDACGIRETAGKISFEIAGPREHIFFDPARTTAGIVTCGGLCPGLNDVIRGLVMELSHRYGVTKIYGFRYGFEGLVPRYGHTPWNLKPDAMDAIHAFGGSILGTSRGQQDIGEMISFLEELEVDLLFVIGGDGSLRCADAIGQEMRKRGQLKSVVGIPKTIDNDIMHLDKSFGFETAFAEAVKAVTCAHVEANGSRNGVGLVKLMGRDSGFIACFAALAGSVVNFVLIPEVRFDLDGPRGFLEALRYRVARRKHAVIVVAEGAGQHLMESAGNATDATNATDASGNRRLGDIGFHLKDRIGRFFKERHMECKVKYIDPSYIISSVPASPQDNVYCSRLAQNAVHAAMAGKTGMLVGRWHGTFIHLPLEVVTQGRRKVDPAGELWHSVLENTGQPAELY